MVSMVRSDVMRSEEMEVEIFDKDVSSGPFLSSCVDDGGDCFRVELVFKGRLQMTGTGVECEVL